MPLLLLAVWLHRSELSRSSYWSISPFAAIAAAYFWAAFSARATHLHFNDGTFSLSAPFWSVLAGSMANLLWDWGFAAMALLACLKQARWLSLCRIAGIWMVATLLPYSFLLHMARVPSRHTYFASVGLSLVVAAGLLALRSWSAKRNNPWLVPIAAAVIVVHQSGYVALVKHRQYALRAEPTERLLEIGRQSPGSIFAKCFPYSPWVARYAFQVRSIDAILVTGQDAKLRTAAVDLCNSAAHE